MESSFFSFRSDYNDCGYHHDPKVSKKPESRRNPISGQYQCIVNSNHDFAAPKGKNISH